MSIETILGAATITALWPFLSTIRSRRFAELDKHKKCNLHQPSCSLSHTPIGVVGETSRAYVYDNALTLHIFV